VIGASRDEDKYGTIVYRRLKARGEQVYPVNPNTSDIGGEVCYASLADLPQKVEQIVVVVPPHQTEQVIQEAAEQGVRRVWMQPGAESDAAVEYCRRQGMQVVMGRCILRYIDQLELQGSMPE
jgi:predicted CoA-binding protein